MADHVDLDAERSVLGALVLEPERFPEAAALVAEADFYRRAHQHVWAALARLHTAGTPIDFLTLRTALEAARQLDEVTPLYLVTKTLRDYRIAHKLAWGSGLWEPLWPTRAAYLADFKTVRAEFLAAQRGRILPFAERCLRYAEQHRAAGLTTATDDEIRAAMPQRIDKKIPLHEITR